MKIENIDARGIMAENGLFATEGNSRVREDKTAFIDDETKILRTQRVDSAGYDRDMLSGAASCVEGAFDASDDTGMTSMKKMLKMLGADEYEELEKNDYSPKAMEERRITTVVDKIQLEMAKAGLDISKMASDLDSKDIEAITGSAAVAADIETAIAKANEIKESGALTRGENDYLLSNELEPTIDNVYAAKFSGAGADGRGLGSQNETGERGDKAQARADFEAIISDAKRIIEAAGLKVTDDTIGEARYLFENQLPVTSDNIRLLDTIFNNDLITSENVADNATADPVVDAIVDAALEGRAPGEAYLLPGYSAMDRAQSFAEYIDAATPEQIASRDGIDDITARRVLEETRLAMSVEANFSLLKHGIAIDTEPLAKVVEELKIAEQSYYEAVFGADDTESGVETTKGNAADVSRLISSYESTRTAVSMLYQAPAYTLGQVDIKSDSLGEIRNVGWDLKDRFDRAGEVYETLGTSPRADLGDSIKKAFGNVGDILKDLGLETSNENQRAARILGYNRMEITAESVLGIREADETVQRAFKSLTPAVVARMVQEGVNPLDMTMDELNAKANEIKNQYNIDNDSERFSRFLVKLEQNKQINEEERSAYIGIYRLISRVEATDGAAIGSLLAQDKELTMRNLMTAVRTARKARGGFDESVDDSSGTREVSRSELTITQQIEMNIATNQLRTSGEMMTPQLLKSATGEGKMDADALLDMTPNELLFALESGADTEAAKEEAMTYAKTQIEEMQQAADSERGIYELIKELSLPVTADNLQAAGLFIDGRNKLFSDLISDGERAAKRNTDRSGDRKVDSTMELVPEDGPDIGALIEKCIQEFGDKSKTPEDMASAQEALAELAEHAMDGMITEEEVSSVDIRGMKLIKTATHFLREMAKQDSYNLPIKVNDATGNVSVKIVHGENKKGLVELLFSCRELGDVRGSLHYESDGISYELASESESVRGLLEEGFAELDDILAKEADKREDKNEVSDRDLTGAAGRVLQFLKDLAERA